LEKKAIYSIGHGTRSAQDLLALLQKFGILYLIDVRSVPHSAFNPQFNQAPLKAFLENNNVHYVFMGDALGGRPKDRLCYKLNGKVDYSIVKTRPFFIKGIHRLKTAYDKNIPVAFMCSEYKPEHCHRSRLIAAALYEQGINVMHIDENGALKDHATLAGAL